MKHPGYLIAASAIAAIACGGSQVRKSPIPASYSDPATQPDDYEERGPLLWEVVGDGGNSFLFGTIHAGVSPAEGLPESVLSKLRSCRTFIMETDLRDIDPRELQAMARLPEGQTLREAISEEAWTALEQAVRAPFSADQLETSRVWFAQIAVLQSLYPTPVSLDAQLLAEAEAAGLALEFLEDWQFQIRLLDEVSKPSDLVALLDPASKSRQVLDRLIAAYRAGDFEALTEAALDPELVSAAPDKYRKMFDDRNRDWVVKLRKPLQRGRAFVAVGAGHFGGEQGLVELLRAEGFLVRRARLKTRATARDRMRFGAGEKPGRFVHSWPIPQ